MFDNFTNDASEFLK